MRKFVIFDTRSGQQVAVQPMLVRAVVETGERRVSISYGSGDQDFADVDMALMDVIDMLEAKD